MSLVQLSRARDSERGICWRDWEVVIPGETLYAPMHPNEVVARPRKERLKNPP